MRLSPSMPFWGGRKTGGKNVKETRTKRKDERKMESRVEKIKMSENYGIRVGGTGIPNPFWVFVFGKTIDPGRRGYGGIGTYRIDRCRHVEKRRTCNLRSWGPLADRQRAPACPRIWWRCPCPCTGPAPPAASGTSAPPLIPIQSYYYVHIINRIRYIPAYS